VGRADETLPGSLQVTTNAIDRRRFLTLSAAAVGAAAHTPRIAGAGDLGPGSSAYGVRSPLEHSARTFRAESVTPATRSSRTPLQDLYGIITPSALHYEAHHAGVPALDPRTHSLLVHGLVDRPLVFSLGDLLRFPSESRVHFIECAGNSAREQAGIPGDTPQSSHGLLSCSEWTGVPLKVLLQEAGVNSSARWIVAEGADASRHSRSIPMHKALDDVLVAYGQNGEAVRPEQGYPMRLVVPGWEGNVNVKWLSQVRVAEAPTMSRAETAQYVDLMPDGRSWQFSFVMEAKSVITRPAGGQTLPEPGAYEITGLAWSGRGWITRAEVSADGGKTWTDALLQDPVMPKALTRFALPWVWNGQEAVLLSRCTDETGYRQPTREELIAVRGLKQGGDGLDHYNGIKAWFVHANGEVRHV
jgi:sulfane dehydrogenase subunit SoxC